MTEETEPAVNFEMAAVFLAQARAAHETGDKEQFIAARKMVMVALGVDDTGAQK